MTDEPPSCEVAIEPAWLPTDLDLERLARRCTEAVAAHLRVATAHGMEVGFRFTDDAVIRQLNFAWRGQDKATDVLSFPATDPDAAPIPGQPLVLGDVVLGHGVCARDAAALERPLAAHVTHLIVHGLLHLFHYDHDASEDAQRMEDLEVAILRELGVPDPYAGRPLTEET
jgi:probable rRNA maturation factor